MTDVLNPPTGMNAQLWALLLEDIEERSHPVRHNPEAATAYRALTAAMEHHPPACTDDDRFTAKEVTDHDPLGAICSSCPIRRECGTYAELANPETGFWAGHTYEEKR